MTWEETKGYQYLIKSYYDNESGLRKQKSLGRRSVETETLKADFERERAVAQDQKKVLGETLKRQSAINRVIGLGRVPLLSAEIVRQLDGAGLLGAGIRIVGTHALFAYEAACGVFFEPGVTTTEDIDFLYDTRQRLNLIGEETEPNTMLLDILRKADRSFERINKSYRVQNQNGFVVDLIKPMRNPPWKPEPAVRLLDDDLDPAAIEGLVWLENSPSFEQLALDERGAPVHITTVDPRAFAIHKHWVSKREDRDPLKRRRDLEQARQVAGLVRAYLPQLPFNPQELRMIPKQVVDAAMTDFSAQT